MAPLAIKDLSRRRNTSVGWSCPGHNRKRARTAAGHRGSDPAVWSEQRSTLKAIEEASSLSPLRLPRRPGCRPVPDAGHWKGAGQALDRRQHRQPFKMFIGVIDIEFIIPVLSIRRGIVWDCWLRAPNSNFPARPLAVAAAVAGHSRLFCPRCLRQEGSTPADASLRNSCPPVSVPREFWKSLQLFIAVTHPCE